MTATMLGGPATQARPAPPEPPRRTVAGHLIKAVLLGLTAAIAIWAAFPLIENEKWIGLAVLAATTAGLFFLYLTPRHIPLKYLAPGTILLILFQVFPVLYTASTAFTNFGDGHRGSKQEAVVALQ